MTNERVPPRAPANAAPKRSSAAVAQPPTARLRPELAELCAYSVTATPPRIKLDANESPWSLSQDARQGLGEALAALPYHRYPDGRADALRHSLATRAHAAPETLVIGAGSDEVIAMLLTAYGGTVDDSPPTVVFPGPTFVMYRMSALTHGFAPIEVDLDASFQLDANAMHRAMDAHQPRLAFYASPNNPTGAPFDPHVLRELIASHPATLHIIDEAYAPFDRATPTDRPATVSAWTETFANVGVMGTLSKIGLAAMRVGWVQLHPELAEQIEKVRQPFNVPSASQEGARYLLEHQGEELERAVQRIVQERQRLEGALLERGFEPQPTRANFVLARIPRAWQRQLLERGVGIRFFTDPRLEGWARITVGRPAETNALLHALDAIRDSADAR